jgi:hypothetical protein
MGFTVLLLIASLLFFPTMPMRSVSTRGCCPADTQSVAYKYLGHGFVSGYVSMNGTTATPNRYYLWCDDRMYSRVCAPLHIGNIYF